MADDYERELPIGVVRNREVSIAIDPDQVPKVSAKGYD